ncbi:hypothetical protein ASPFODRAFT_38020 [Aspergillus luchuensis CBS 106.47]|uniref:FAD/NAD(P)-binding domain-containing protein n=1 Tax=Aspergillus luchuensis (strain CBS 106.47) TaxID=1137211 RepID=A0A1M3T1G9_ASPLC|nr:hypothetical protein ASPFODRAFT_38020 [Aspergillus luchuensis CBS 106.47]
MRTKILRSYLSPCERLSNRNSRFYPVRLRPSTDRPASKVAGMQGDVVIVGGSYAGIAATLTLLALKDGQPIPLAAYGDYYQHLCMAARIPGLRITVVDERDGFFHSVGGPLAYCSPEHAARMWRLYRGFPKLNRPDVTFVQGTVVRVDASTRTVSYQSPEGQQQDLPYDYLLAATGLRRPWPVVPRTTEMRSYLADAGTAARRLSAAGKIGIVVIGGGAVGVEFAGKLKTRYPATQITLIHARDQLLSNEPVPATFREKVQQLLEAQGVQVILRQRPRVEELPDGTSYVKFDNGDRIHAAQVIQAVKTGARPSTEWLPPTLVGDRGMIAVNDHLQVTDDPTLSDGRIFAAGDLVARPEIKLGGRAMVMGSVAAANIYAALLADPRRALCPPFPAHMAISVGSSMVLWKGNDDPEIYHGEALAKTFFGEDLGWQKILNALTLDHYEVQGQRGTENPRGQYRTHNDCVFTNRVGAN